MPNFTMTHEINCDADTFWEIFFDREFNEKLYLEGLQFPAWSIVEQGETDTEITRKVVGQPKLNDLPGPVAKLLGSSFKYTEQGTFNKATKTWEFKMTPSTLADKMRQGGTLKLESAGEGKIKRVVEIINEAKIFGVGGLLEKTAEKSLRQGWDDSAKFTNEWIAKKK